MLDFNNLNMVLAELLTFLWQKKICKIRLIDKAEKSLKSTYIYLFGLRDLKRPRLWLLQLPQYQFPCWSPANQLNFNFFVYKSLNVPAQYTKYTVLYTYTKHMYPTRQHWICALWARKNHQHLTDLRPSGAEKPPASDRSAPSGRGKTTNT
jgi:hypothetical protein